MNKVSELWAQIEELVNNTTPDVEKFERGNATAGTRVRKAMQELKNLAQEVRVAVQEIKNAEK